MGSNVVSLPIPPKQMTRSYRQKPYTVTFIPATKEWFWEVELVHVTKHSGTAETTNKAFKAAEKLIDNILGVAHATAR